MMRPIEDHCASVIAARATIDLRRQMVMIGAARDARLTLLLFTGLVEHHQASVHVLLVLHVNILASVPSHHYLSLASSLLGICSPLCVLLAEAEGRTVLDQNLVLFRAHFLEGLQSLHVEASAIGAAFELCLIEVLDPRSCLAPAPSVSIPALESWLQPLCFAARYRYLEHLMRLGILGSRVGLLAFRELDEFLREALRLYHLLRLASTQAFLRGRAWVIRLRHLWSRGPCWYLLKKEAGLLLVLWFIQRVTPRRLR